MPSIFKTPTKDVVYCTDNFLWSFQTDFNPASHGTFDPTLFYSGSGSIIWRFENGEILTGASISTTGTTQGLDGTVQTVFVEIPDPSMITGIDFNTDRIYGTITIPSEFSGLSALNLSTNPTLTSIVNEGNSATWSQYWAYSCNITGVLNVSNYSGLGGDIRLYSNPLLTGITSPSSTSTVVSNFQAYSCGLTGTLNVSGYSNLGGVFQVQSNSGLTGITFPTGSSQTFTGIQANNCNLSSVDISNLTTGTTTYVIFANNTNMTSFTRKSTLTLNALNISFTRLSTFSFTGITFAGGTPYFQINNSTAAVLTSITGTPSGSINLLRVDANTALAGTLDLSGFTSWTGNGDLRFNSTAITSINHGTTTGTIRTWFGNSTTGATYWSIGNTSLSNVSQNFTFNSSTAMTSGNVDSWLIQLDSKLATGTGTINMAGTTAAPTAASAAAKSSLITKGYSVTTN